jgi:hypothetical protein
VLKVLLLAKSIRIILSVFGMGALVVGILATAAPQAYSAGQSGSEATPRPENSRAFPNEGQSNSRLPKQPDVLTTTNWTNLFPNLTAVSAISASEAWAVGESGHMMHYNGGTWVTVDLPGGPTFNDVKMLSSSSGFALGDSYRFFEYDGANWISRDDSMRSVEYLYRLSAIDADDIWGIGQAYISDAYHASIAHYDGTYWDSSGPVFSTTVDLQDIDMVSATDGLVLGYDYSTNPPTILLYHYDGSNWTQMPAPPTATYLDKIDAYAPGDVWVTGYDGPPSYASKVYRYNGGTWMSWETPDGNAPGHILVLNPSEAYATTYNSILRWNGTTWTVGYTGRNTVSLSGVNGAVWGVGPADTILTSSGVGPWTLQQGGPTTNTLNGVSILSTDEAWAVGFSGTVLRYVSGSWQQVPTSLTNTLYDVQMLSSTDGYAVGSATIAHWDGTAWTRVATPTRTMRGVFMTSPGEGWAVGYSGSIWRATGGVWGTASSPTTLNLYSVAMDSVSHGWAVGYSYVSGSYVIELLEYDGTNWIDRSNTLPATAPLLSDIWLAPGGATGVAVGSRNSAVSNSRAIMRLSDGIWSSDESYTTSSPLYSVTGGPLDEVWAQGCSTRQLIGGIWESVSLPGYHCQNSIAILPGRVGWSVGYDGIILKYDPLSDGRRYYDVALDSTFYSFIECMATRGIISGYGDNTFRPNNNITRGQLSKIVSNSAGFSDPAGTRMFEDVPVGSPFYDWIQRLASRGFIGGYACGGEGEPCGSDNKPYFRPNANTTRGQISKIVSNAAGYSDPPGTQIFEDVPATNGFYQWIQRLASRGIMGGYACGGEGEPCVAPDNRPYFRPNNSATRGQVAKIVTNSFFPDCQNP